MFLAAVGLAVAAIPEGLPAVLTITLAIGVERMARRNAIIRRLPAVETLGSVTVICSDKTGTLTKNEMTAQAIATAEHLFEVSGVGYDPHGAFSLAGRGEAVEARAPSAARRCAPGGAAVQRGDAAPRRRTARWVVDGDPTEGALLTAGLKAGLDLEFEREAYPRTDTIPFESEHRFMATLHHDHDGRGFIYVKGAPERVLGMCARERAGERRAAARRSLLAPARRGARGARAARPGGRDQSGRGRPSGAEVRRRRGWPHPARPVRPDRPAAGGGDRGDRRLPVRRHPRQDDHRRPRHHRARHRGQLGLANDRDVITGPELDALAEDELRRLAPEVDVFARASPEHKLRLVEALQADGAVVAMTGDGVNDAPALKRADVGVAMGQKGTEAAKEAAEMVLADDNFASIAHAVEEGRTVYDNLKKSILFILPTNGGEALTIIAAIMFGGVLPITPVQILWVNMVTAITLAVALAFERAEPDIMRRPPRDPGEPILSRFLVWRIGFVSLLFLAGIFGLFLWARSRGSSIEEGRTLAVNALVAMQVFYLFNVRYLGLPSLTFEGVVGTRAVLIAIGAVTALQFLFTYAPIMHTLFETRPLTIPQGLLAVAVAIAGFAIIEIEKASRRRLRWADGGARLRNN